MKTMLYIIGCGIIAIWVVLVDFSAIPDVKPLAVKAWQPSNDGIIEIKHAKVDVSNAQNKCKLEIQKAKQYIEQLKIIENDSLIRLSQNDLVE